MLDDVLWATLGLIFLTTIISAFVRLRQRDECLKLLDDHHVTLLRGGGRAVFGDARVYGHGMELVYTSPRPTPHGLQKTGYLVSDGELDGMWALCRAVGQLTPAERAERQAQLDRRVNPPPLRRAMRGWRNAMNTLRDAFSRAMTAIVGQITKASGNKALAAEQKSVSAAGSEIVGAATNAYEPMLEAHVGRPVVVALAAGDSVLEVAGYLAEYSDRFLALFNVDHAPLAHYELKLWGDAPEGMELTADDEGIVLRNTAEHPLVIESVHGAAGEAHRIGASLLRGASVSLPRPSGEVSVRAQRVARVDLVCPRAIATVRYSAREAG